jgi:hypothetical protein
LLHSRGLLAGAGSAASLIAAAFASLLFATGLVAFRSWPGASGSPVPSVHLPSAPASTGVPTGARGRASDVAAAATVVLPAAGRPANGATTARRIARTGGRGGSTSTPAGATGTAAPSTSSGSGGSQPPAGQPAVPSVTRQVTNGLADTTTNVTHNVGSTVGGPVGSAVEQTGGQAAQTVRDVGSATEPLLGALGG